MKAGVLLAEALVALVLSGVIAVAAGLALSGSRRALARTEALARAERAALESTAIASALLADASAVAIEGDTAALFPQQIAASVICAVEGDARWIPPLRRAGGPPFTLRAQPVEAGDVAVVLVPDSLARAVRSDTLEVASVAHSAASPGCDEGDGWATALDATEERIRLTFTAAPDSSLGAGSVVRIARRGRLAPYADGRGEWMLGLRRCDATGLLCGTVQPVAGPLASPARRGFRLARLADGALLVEARGVTGSGVARRVVPPRVTP